VAVTREQHLDAIYERLRDLGREIRKYHEQCAAAGERGLLSDLADPELGPTAPENDLRITFVDREAGTADVVDVRLARAGGRDHRAMLRLGVIREARRHHH